MQKKVSNSFYSLALLGLLAGFNSALTAQDNNAASGSVYKQVDPEGNVTYTDKPPSADAKAMKVPKGTEYAPPQLPTFTPSTSQSERPRRSITYDRLAIVAPQNDESIWDNTGNITVTVEVEPNLQSGHSIEFLLDGAPVAKGSATSHQFENVDRGTHQITARIVNDQDEAIESASVTVHLKRHHK